MVNPLFAHAFSTPALRKDREGRGTHGVGDTDEIKSLGHPPLREWAYVRHYFNSEERDQQLSPWIEHYNFHRPHGSLGYAPPISRVPSIGTTS